MGTGVDWEYVERNPVAGVKLPPGKPVKRAPVLPLEKLGELIARLPEPYRTMAVLGTTGMRESEILGLRWDDFDTEKLVIRVRLAPSTEDRSIRRRAKEANATSPMAKSSPMVLPGYAPRGWVVRNTCL